MTDDTTDTGHAWVIGNTGYVARQAIVGVILLDRCWRVRLLFASVFYHGAPCSRGVAARPERA
jgi:hypothetical protein